MCCGNPRRAKKTEGDPEDGEVGVATEVRLSGSGAPTCRVDHVTESATSPVLYSHRLVNIGTGTVIKPWKPMGSQIEFFEHESPRKYRLLLPPLVGVFEDSGSPGSAKQRQRNAAQMRRCKSLIQKNER